MVFSGLVEPTQVHKTVETVGITPGIAREPGKLFCRLSKIKTTGGSGKTSDTVNNTCPDFLNTWECCPLTSIRLSTEVIDMITKLLTKKN